VTLSAPDYDAIIAQEPTAWRDRGLHWHCYSWTGSGADYANDRLREDNSAASPPLMVREWLNKPRSMLRHVAHTPEDALSWLEQEHRELFRQALYTDEQTHRDQSFSYRHALYDLRLGNDVVWGEWIKGPRNTRLAVIGTSEGCHRP
jgi:hypothetical protein